MDKEWAAVFIATTAIGVGQGFLPNITDIRGKFNNPDAIRDLRLGQGASTLAILGIGITASYVLDTPIPIVSAAITTFLLATLYEYALRGDA
jgi:hypothetical protein